MQGSSGANYEARFTSVFQKNFGKLEKAVQERIKHLVDGVIENPFYNSPFLAGQFRGKRKKRAGKYRVTFAVCEECRRLGHTALNGCADCTGMDNEAIKFFDCGHRDKFYD
ncbi:MAG: hypothetical protein V1676_01025 [Candidatus Diapherotrites archaeon]